MANDDEEPETVDPMVLAELETLADRIRWRNPEREMSREEARRRAVAKVAREFLRLQSGQRLADMLGEADIEDGPPAA